MTQPTPPLDDIRPDPEALHFARASAPLPGPQLAPEIPKDEPDTQRIIEAAWRRENILSKVFSQNEPQDDRADGPTWNPYAYAKANQDAYEDVLPYVLKGHFDNIHSERDFHAKAEFIRKQIEDKEVLDSGGWRSFAAQLGVGLLDPTNLLPMGRGALKGAAYLAGATAGTEAILHAYDPTRTLEESAIAIGAGAPLGGVFGHLSRHWDTPDKPLHPDHPQNPLRDRNLNQDEIIEAKPGEALGEGVRINAASINAAAVDYDLLKASITAEGESTKLARGEGLAGVLQRVTERIFDRGTPLSRIWSMPDITRGIGLRIMDPGGRLTTGMVKGRTMVSAEALQAVDRQELATLLNDIALDIRQVNMAVGQTLNETRVKSLGNSLRPLGEGDFNKVEEIWFTQAVLDRQWSKMLDRRQMGVEANHPAKVKADLLKQGFTPEEADAIEAQVAKTAKRIEDHFGHYGRKGVVTGLMDESLNLGKHYGAPVLYLREAVNANPDGFRAILQKQMMRDAPDDFLEAYAAEIGSTLADIKLNKPLYEKALIAWRGDYEEAVREATLDRISELGQAYDRHLDELDVVLNGVRTVKNEKNARTVAAIRKKVRAAEASYWERRIGAKIKKAEEAAQRVRELREKYPDIEDLADDIQDTFAKNGDQVDRMADFLKGKLAAKKAAKTEAAELSAALRKDRPELEALHTAEHIAERRAEVTAAIEARKKAVAEANEAMAELRKAARESRNSNRWLDAVAHRIQKNKDDLDVELNKPGLDALLEGEASRIAQMKQLAAEAEQARRHWVREAREVAQGLKLTRAEGRAILKDARAAKKLMARIERSKPMHEVLDAMVEKIRGGLDVPDHMPNGMLFDVSKDTGRLKERTIQWYPDLWRELKDGGFVNTDLYSILNQHHREMSGRLALQQTLGTTDLTKVLKDIRAEFDDLIRAARAKGELDAAELLNKQRDVAVADITAVFNKTRGISRSGGEGDENIVWWADKLRGGVFIAAGGGMVFSAMSDVAAGMLSTAGFFPGLVKHARGYHKILEKARAGDPDFQELRTLLASMEHAVNIHTEHSMLSDVKTGFGSPYAQTLKQKVDKAMPRIADRVSTISGLSGFSNWVRRTAGLTQLSNIARDVQRYADLSDATRANLTALGIGPQEARQMAALFKQHGKEVDGIFTPGLAAWRKHPNGDELANRLNHALVLAQRRASYVPGHGALPLMMNKWYGALLMQFQSYAFQFTHSFLLAGTQRLATVGETRFLGAVATMIFCAAAVSSIRAFIRGENASEKDTAWWANEVVQRSGLLGYTGPYVDAMVKAFGPTANEFLGAKVFEASSKYRNNNVAGSLVGPWLNYVNQPVKAATALADGDTERASKVVFNMLPLHQTAQAVGALSNWATDE